MLGGDASRQGNVSILSLLRAGWVQLPLGPWEGQAVALLLLYAQTEEEGGRQDAESLQPQFNSLYASFEQGITETPKINTFIYDTC